MNPTILTASGRYFNFVTPTQDSIRIEDIATALSRICRFTGHTRKFYSVAQHSVLVSRTVPTEFAMQGLMHDAAEAYLGDVSSPLKKMLPEYKVIENRVEQAICERYGLPFPMHPSIKQADLRLLVTEKRDLMPSTDPAYMAYAASEWNGYNEHEPLQFPIFPLGPRAAQLSFLRRYRELRGE